MDPHKLNYPILLRQIRPILDLFQDVFRDDKLLIRCLEEIEDGLIICIPLYEKYYIYDEFTEMYVKNMEYKFNTDEKVVKEFSKYIYGYDKKVSKDGFVLEFGIFNEETQRMVQMLRYFPYKYLNNKLVKNFNLELKIDY